MYLSCHPATNIFYMEVGPALSVTVLGSSTCNMSCCNLVRTVKTTSSCKGCALQLHWLETLNHLSCGIRNSIPWNQMPPKCPTSQPDWHWDRMSEIEVLRVYVTLSQVLCCSWDLIKPIRLRNKKGYRILSQSSRATYTLVTRKRPIPYQHQKAKVVKYL